MFEQHEPPNACFPEEEAVPITLVISNGGRGAIFTDGLRHVIMINQCHLLSLYPMNIHLYVLSCISKATINNNTIALHCLHISGR